MKDYLNHLKNKLKDYLDAIRWFFPFIVLWLLLIWARGWKAVYSFVFFIILSLIYYIIIFIWARLEKKGIDKIIYKVLEFVFTYLIGLPLLLFLLDFFLYMFFKEYLGYNYFSWVECYIFNKP